MKKLNLFMSLLLITVLLLPFAFALQADDADGKELFTENRCDTCHAVSTAAIEAKTKSDKMKGGDLAGYTPEDQAAVIAYLQGESEMDGEKHRTKFKGDAAELKALLDWLGAQK